jgi:hypothetical protein
MTYANYPDATDRPISPQEKKDLQNATEKFRDMLVKNGYAREVADALDFTLERYRFPQDCEHNGGREFYVLTLSGPGDFSSDVQKLDSSKAYTAHAPAQQVTALAFEIGVNLFNNMTTSINTLRYIKHMQENGLEAAKDYVVDLEKQYYINSYMYLNKVKMQVAFNGVSPAEFMNALNFATDCHLQRHADKFSAPAAPKGGAAPKF